MPAGMWHRVRLLSAGDIAFSLDDDEPAIEGTVVPATYRWPRQIPYWLFSTGRVPRKPALPPSASTGFLQVGKFLPVRVKYITCEFP